jgi:hypothetical protein
MQTSHPQRKIRSRIAYNEYVIRIERITTYAHEGGSRAQSVFRTVAAQPSWVSRIALMAFLIVIGLPLFLLFLLALLTAIVIFSVLALANALVMAVRGALPRRSDGRENVRVIRRV